MDGIVGDSRTVDKVIGHREIATETVGVISDILENKRFTERKYVEAA